MFNIDYGIEFAQDQEECTILNDWYQCINHLVVLRTTLWRILELIKAVLAEMISSIIN